MQRCLFAKEEEEKPELVVKGFPCAGSWWETEKGKVKSQLTSAAEQCGNLQTGFLPAQMKGHSIHKLIKRCRIRGSCSAAANYCLELAVLNPKSHQLETAKMCELLREGKQVSVPSRFCWRMVCQAP